MSRVFFLDQYALLVIKLKSFTTENNSELTDGQIKFTKRSFWIIISVYTVFAVAASYSIHRMGTYAVTQPFLDVINVDWIHFGAVCSLALLDSILIIVFIWCLFSIARFLEKNIVFFNDTRTTYMKVVIGLLSFAAKVCVCV